MCARRAPRGGGREKLEDRHALLAVAFGKGSPRPSLRSGTAGPPPPASPASDGDVLLPLALSHGVGTVSGGLIHTHWVNDRCTLAIWPADAATLAQFEADIDWRALSLACPRR